MLSERLKKGVPSSNVRHKEHPSTARHPLDSTLMYDVRRTYSMQVLGRLVLISAFLLPAMLPQVPERFPPDIIPRAVLEDRDALRTDPIHYRLELENDRVRVLRLSLKASESVPQHDDADALAVCLTDCHLGIASPDGHSEDIHLRAGETHWLYGGTRSEKNLGKAMEMLFIESKAGSR